MFILVDTNNVCRFNGNMIEYGIFDEPIEKWKITNNLCIFYVLGDNYTSHDVGSLPEDYLDTKYCYTEEDGFYLDPNYSEPINIEKEVELLKQENTDLKSQLESVQEALDFLTMR